MEIRRSGSQPSTAGPAEDLSGTVRIDPLFQSAPPARAAGAKVTFEPGARTACRLAEKISDADYEAAATNAQSTSVGG